MAGRRRCEREDQSARRGRAKAPKAVRPPTTHIASGPRQVWCWDMTYLPAITMGFWFHLYLILDLYNRKILGWEVHDSDHSGHAAHLVRRRSSSQRHPVRESVAAVRGPRSGDSGGSQRAVLASTREKSARWSGDTRNWSPIGAVTLYPERDCVIKAHSGYNDIERLAA